MTKTRNDYVYQLIGKILSKVKRKSKKYPETYYYQLNTSVENKEVKKIFAFLPRLENEVIWKVIENSDYLDKKYLFYCKNHQGYYGLIDWEELPSSFTEKAKELARN